MNFFDHLRELRTCLIRVAWAVAAGAIAAYYFIEEVFHFLTAPYTKYFATGALIGTGPAEAFVLKLKVAVFAGAVFSAPVIFWQIWRFIAPGLYENEKRIAIPFVLSTTFLFFLGVWFCYTSVLPFAYEFFSEEYQSIGLTPNIKLDEHLSVVIQGMLGFGAVFQWPAIAFFLARMGIINDQTLIKGFRYAVVIIFVISAVLTPPDVMTQFLMAGPLLLLYGLSIIVVRWAAKAQTGEEAADQAEKS